MVGRVVEVSHAVVVVCIASIVVLARGVRCVVAGAAVGSRVDGFGSAAAAQDYESDSSKTEEACNDDDDDDECFQGGADLTFVALQIVTYRAGGALHLTASSRFRLTPLAV